MLVELAKALKRLSILAAPKEGFSPHAHGFMIGRAASQVLVVRVNSQAEQLGVGARCARDVCEVCQCHQLVERCPHCQLLRQRDLSKICGNESKKGAARRSAYSILFERKSAHAAAQAASSTGGVRGRRRGHIYLE